MNFSQSVRHLGETLHNRYTYNVVGVRKFRENGRTKGRNILVGVKQDKCNVKGFNCKQKRRGKPLGIKPRSIKFADLLLAYRKILRYSSSYLYFSPQTN